MTKKSDIIKDKVAQDISALWGLTDIQADMLKTHIELQKYKKNEIIYKKFDYPTKAMCLIQGKVKIYKDGIGGRNQIIRVIKPIEFFGFRAYFASENYRTAAMAFENSWVVSFPWGILMKLMKANFNVSMFFIKYLSIEIGKSDDRIVSLTQKHIRARLAEALLFLQDSYGLEEDGYTLSIYLSREDLANLSNMTTSNAIRTLSSFANEKIIAIDGRKIKLLDTEALRSISQQG